MKYRYNARVARHRFTSRKRLVFAVVVALAILAGVIAVTTKHQDTAHPRTRAATTMKPPHAPLPLPAPTPAAPQPTGKSYGIAAGSSLAGLSDQALDGRLAAIQALGATWVRFDFDWSNIQPGSASTYNWSNYDRLVAAAGSHHLKTLAILDFTPAWARPAGCGSSHCAPKDAGAFATFAGEAAKRYKAQGVDAWEIWNEPNNPEFWQPKADPAAYISLLAGAANAIHAQDRTATVITGGLSPQSTAGNSYAPVDFLKAVYAAGGKPYFDAVGDHPYTFPLSPASSQDQAWAQMAAPSSSLRSTMVDNGDSAKKIWITEFGSPTGGPGPVATVTNPDLDAHPFAVDQALQAKILSDAAELYKTYDWAGPFFYYSYQDAGTTNDTNENFFGLVAANGTHKPAYDVFKQAANGH